VASGSLVPNISPMNLSGNLKGYLLRYGLRLIRSTGDGHCFIYSVQTALQEQLGIFRDITCIKSVIFTETINRSELYRQFLTTGYNLLHDLNSYILHKNYNTSFGDLLPNIFANAQCVNLRIVDQSTGSLNIVEISPISGPGHATITVHRCNGHYNGIGYLPTDNSALPGPGAIHPLGPRVR
jgi:hypothetical protein